jgi:rhodanese-related sulfurtransferase
MFNPKVNNVSGEEAYNIINENKDVIILDVRTKEEYDNGHLHGAKLIPVGVLSSRISELEKFREKPILVYCASGGRSPQAVKYLLQGEFSQIYHLTRGISSWRYGIEK